MTETGTFTGPRFVCSYNSVMAVELDGKVRMRGSAGPGAAVRILADPKRLKIVSGNDLVGDWERSEVGIVALQDGFSIRAEGEEFTLLTEDDVAFAEEFGIVAVSPRLARKMAARHNPEVEDAEPAPIEISSNLAAIGFAVAGALVVLGGVLLNMSPADEVVPFGEFESSGSEFWVAFVVGGALMVAAAFVMSIGTPISRLVATVALFAVIAIFVWAISATEGNSGELTAYGFIAGGVVVGVAVLVAGNLRSQDY